MRSEKANKAEKYLNQMFRTKIYLNANREKLHELKDLLSGVKSPKLDAERVSGGEQVFDKTGLIVSAIEDIKKEIEKQIAVIVKFEKEAYWYISLMDDKEEKTVLIYRYMLSHSIEEIEALVFRERTWIYKKLNSGLESFYDVFEKNNIKQQKTTSN